MKEPRNHMLDALSGGGWIILGGIFAILSLQMDRREHLGATFFTAPGFVPFMLGLALAFFGVVLVVRSLKGHVPEMPELRMEASGVRALVALGLMSVYALVLVGRMPFWLATFLFVSTFIVTFGVKDFRPRAVSVLLVKAMLTGALTAAVVSFVFQEVFLVRLP
ncbi:tripartite tricarboxylate transporter TctB family protein [Telmatospirillum sp. J64-1]|uniref:tripartite tricarboxylate transporter TctB family protein n=1 Tax=Telmatospirillum sp. J64-1 TaxID=2502183 RepID=UPI00115D3CA2|nr:tripartite tricarboxylate transporter TctB family protein [Telmatospirillum sp. J64-1]